MKEAQENDAGIAAIQERNKSGEAPDCGEDDKGNIWFRDRLLVPDQQEIRDVIMKEAHESAYSIHPNTTKMYQDLKESF